MKELFKRFVEWIGRKEKLHAQAHKPPLVSERDLWWVAFGENIGQEMNGGGVKFARPAIILKKLAHGFYLVAPTTTKQHEGSWYVHIRHANVDEYVCLHQIRTIDHRRLDRKMGQIDTDDFSRIIKAFIALYGKNESPPRGGGRG
ncbi:MAG: type II toxin-antitoxin system PemK/MazF family toxin [Patescibacteria group bacterium]